MFRKCIELKKCPVNKRAVLSTADDNSHVVYKCDSCGLFKNHLSISLKREKRGYLCDYCIKTT